MTISWATPSYAPSGSHVAIQHWGGDSCDTAPGSATTDYADASDGSWRNPDTSPSPTTATG